MIQQCRKLGVFDIVDRNPMLEVRHVARLGDELTRTRDGQVVLGRAVPAQEASRWKPRDYARAARETFQLLAPLYRLQ